MFLKVELRFRGERRNSVVEISSDRAEVILGRGQADLDLGCPTVSRKHGVIRPGAAGFVYEDLGGLNGSRVNGILIQRAPISIGDVLQLGDVSVHILGLRRNEITQEIVVGWPGAFACVPKEKQKQFERVFIQAKA